MALTKAHNRMITGSGVNVLDYGAVPDDATDSTTAIQAAINAAATEGLPVIIDEQYAVASAITLPSNTTIIGSGRVRQTSAETNLLTATDVENITIKGITLRGLGTDYDGKKFTGPDPFVGKNGFLSTNTVTVSNFVFDGVTFENFGGNYIRFDGAATSKHILITSCRFFGTNLYGTSMPIVPSGDIAGNSQFAVTLARSDSAVVSNNLFVEVGSGVQTGSECDNINIVGNNMFNLLEQHGCYIQSPRGVVVSGNVIDGTEFTGVKSQFTATTNTNVDNSMSITGNVVMNAKGNGINVVNVGADPTVLVKNVTITGNAIYDAASDAIDVNHVQNAIIGNNTIRAGRSGIVFANGLNVSIADNVISDVEDIGIWVDQIDNGVCKRVKITSNTIVDPCQDAVTSTEFGIRFGATTSYTETCEEILLDGNYIEDTSGSPVMRYAVYVTNSQPQAALRIKNNIGRNGYDYGIRFQANTPALLENDNNIWEGTNGPTLAMPVTPVTQGRVRGVYSGNAAPTSGTYVIGDIVYDESPTAGGSIGFVCTAGGSPGTWKTFGTIAS